MNQWADAAHKAKSEAADPTSHWPVILDAMEEVFDRWCTPKARKYGRLGSFSYPPEYQPVHEKVVEVKRICRSVHM
jgi:hypothetical protein